MARNKKENVPDTEDLSETELEGTIGGLTVPQQKSTGPTGPDGFVVTDAELAAVIRAR